MQSYLQCLAATAEVSSRESDDETNGSLLDKKNTLPASRLDSIDAKNSDGDEAVIPLSPTESVTSILEEKLRTVASRHSVHSEELPEQVRHLLALDDNDTERQVLVSSAWLLTDVLLQGKLFITQDTLLFVSPVKIDNSRLIRAGALSRERESFARGFVRNWFVLRESTLFWYASPDDVYFPHAIIYLANLMTAELRVGSKRKAGFNLILNDGRRIKLRADNELSAIGWVRDLKREIFRCRTRGRNAIIRIPFENVTDTRDFNYLNFLRAIEMTLYRGPDSDSTLKYSFAFLENSEVDKGSVQRAAQKIEKINDSINESRTNRRSRKVYDTTPSNDSETSEVSHEEVQHSDNDSDSDVDAAQSEPTQSNTLTPFRTPVAGLTNVARLPLATFELATKIPGQLAQSISRAGAFGFRGNQEAEFESEATDFRLLFGFSEDTLLLRSVKCYIVRKMIPHSGIMYITDSFLCFRRDSSGSDSVMIMPLADIESVEPWGSMLISNSGFAVKAADLKGDLWYEFSDSNEMNDILKSLREATQNWRSQEKYASHKHSQVPTEEEFLEQSMSSARLYTLYDGDKAHINVVPPIIFDPYLAEVGGLSVVKPVRKMKFTMLTIGSRGDVQPYIALAQGLKSEGHECRIATHAEFGDWIKEHDIDFRPVAGDPGKLMKIMIDHGGFTVGFIRDAVPKFRGWISELLESAWIAVKDDTDILIESPSAMAGLHIAEALKIPYFRAFTMPWTRTRKYPHAFIVPEHRMGGSYNYYSYAIFDSLLWMGISKQVNHWRRSTLKLNSTSLEAMSQQEIPFIYCVSPTVLVPPIDQPDWISYTGYWFLDEDMDSYRPDPKLAAFIQKADDEGKKVVYIGFGSILVEDPEKMTQTVVDAVEQADVRCVLARGWSRRGNKADSGGDITSKNIFETSQVAHTWLFPRINAAVHHGGSGTTGASLRAGIPTIIKPFFGDQFFYANRVADMGVGISLKSLETSTLREALLEATGNDRMINRAEAVGSRIRSELGVKNAIFTLYRQLEYAKSVTEKRRQAQDTHSLLLSASSRLPDVAKLGFAKDRDLKSITSDLVKSLGPESFGLPFFRSKFVP